MYQILVIDDEPTHLDHAVKILRGAGFEALAASSGREGLEFLAANSPNLIFCDANMPEMDGFEVLDRVRAEPKNSTIPFVFFTATRIKGIREEAKQRGAQEYIVKPYKAEALIEAAHRLLGDAAEDAGR